jgi:hypothetical protein
LQLIPQLLMRMVEEEHKPTAAAACDAIADCARVRQITFLP